MINVFPKLTNTSELVDATAFLWQPTSQTHKRREVIHTPTTVSEPGVTLLPSTHRRGVTHRPTAKRSNTQGEKQRSKITEATETQYTQINTHTQSSSTQQEARVQYTTPQLHITKTNKNTRGHCLKLNTKNTDCKHTHTHTADKYTLFNTMHRPQRWTTAFTHSLSTLRCVP